jgi:hypothetical protein
MSVNKRSRYARTPTLQWLRLDGSRVDLIDIEPRPVRQGVFKLMATDGDRLDLLAYRYHRDPLKFWKIADAAPEMDPFDAVETGARLTIPPDK